MLTPGRQLLTHLTGLATSGDEEAGAGHGLQHGRNRPGQDGQALARLVQAPEEADRGRLVGAGEARIVVGRAGEGGDVDAVGDDDGVATVEVDQGAPGLFGDRDPGRDPLQERSHDR